MNYMLIIGLLLTLAGVLAIGYLIAMRKFKKTKRDSEKEIYPLW